MGRIDLSRLRELTPPRFYPLYTDRHRYLHLYGGAGSGKSRFAAQKALVRTITGFSTGVKHTIVALRKTSPAVRKSLYTLFQHYRSAWNLGSVMGVTTSDMSFTFINGSRIICCGLDDPSKLKSIEGVTMFLVEEATEFTRDDLLQIRLRLRGKFASYLQEILMYNPSDMTSPLYDDIYRTRPPRWEGEFENGAAYAMHSTYHDNPFIDDDYKRELEALKEKDEGYYKVYTLGEWGGRKALIYHGYYTVVGVELWPASFDDECYGLDFGFNNPSALVYVGTRDQVPYVREVLYETRLTNTQLIERMRELGVRDDLPIYADSAEPARIQEICDAGFDCRPAEEAKKPNAVKARIDFVQGMRPRFHAESANLLEEAATYKWKEDAKSGAVLDEPVKFRDHLMNAMEYAMFEHMRLSFTSGVAKL